MNQFLTAGIAGALLIGGLALAFWYRTRLLERRTERLLARISSDIDQLVLRTLREQNRQWGPRVPRHDPPGGDSPGDHSPDGNSMSKAA
ncbi:MAG: hypothetical protein RL684_215 [Pseudomonadota bacterium]|jgi:hypothetical protein